MSTTFYYPLKAMIIMCVYTCPNILLLHFRVWYAAKFT